MSAFSQYVNNNVTSLNIPFTHFELSNNLSPLYNYILYITTENDLITINAYKIFNDSDSDEERCNKYIDFKIEDLTIESSAKLEFNNHKCKFIDNKNCNEEFIKIFFASSLKILREKGLIEFECESSIKH